jgi:hypothetical protein
MKKIGSLEITTLGTIATGVWNDTAIANANLANDGITIDGAIFNFKMTKKTLGETRKTIWVFGKPQSMWIPMMNPKYLTENNLWDDRAGYTKKKD